MAAVGALAAFGSSLTWAFASVRYAQVSKAIGSARVNLARAMIVAPFYLIVAFVVHRGELTEGLRRGQVIWLALSVFCSYALADSLFFSSARRIGTSTALSIASTYPLWAVLFGVMLRGERFGIPRAAGTALCIGGVVALVRLAPRAAGVAGYSEERRLRGTTFSGVLLAAITSLLWAGNTICVKLGAIGLDVWRANAIRYGFALGVLAAGVGASRPGRPPSRTDWRRLMPAIVADGILGSTFYVLGLAHTDLAVGATLTALAPLIAVPFAIVMGEEGWSVKRLAAVTMTVAGAVMLVTAA